MRKTLVGMLSVLMVPAIASAWLAYNDFAWDPTQSTDTNLVTTYFGTSGTPSGPLKDYATGLNSLVTVTTSGGGTNRVNHGIMPNSGTDAYGYFNGIIDGVGEWDYGAPDSLIQFTGLNPAYSYNVVLYGNRNNPTYETVAGARVSLYVIESADSWVNQHSTGADIVNYSQVGDAVRITNGYNTVKGWVARYESIDPGADGTFTIRVADGGSVGPPRQYVSGMVFEEIVPEPTTLALFGLGGLLLMLRRKK